MHGGNTHYSNALFYYCDFTDGSSLCHFYHLVITAFHQIIFSWDFRLIDYGLPLDLWYAWFLIMVTNACHSLVAGTLWISEDQREEKTRAECHDLLQHGELSWLLMCGKMCPLYHTTSVFIFFSFHKGCGLWFSTLSWIYQQIYLLLLPASVYIQWASWAWSVWGLTDWWLYL